MEEIKSKDLRIKELQEENKNLQLYNRDILAKNNKPIISPILVENKENNNQFLLNTSAFLNNEENVLKLKIERRQSETRNDFSLNLDDNLENLELTSIMFFLFFY